MGQEVLLQMTDICKEFPGVKALDHVSLTVKKGTVHALMGENGAGKSTLMKCLFGIYSKDAGKIELEGKEVNFKNSREALNNGVAMVHQELNQALKRNVIKAPTPVSESKSANVTPIGPPNGANDAHGVSSVAKAGVSQPKSNPPAPRSHSAAVSVSASAIHRSALREGVSHIATHAAAAQQSAQTAASSTSPTQASTSGKRPNSCIERTDHSNPIVKAASANKNPKNAAWAGLCAETINPSPKSRAVSPHRCADHGANAAA